jgi:hypothetical protein
MRWLVRILENQVKRVSCRLGEIVSVTQLEVNQKYLSHPEPYKRRRHFGVVGQKCRYLVMKANPELLDKLLRVRITEISMHHYCSFRISELRDHRGNACSALLTVPAHSWAARKPVNSTLT